MNGINILIYLLDGNMPIAQFIENKQIYLSVITELELFGKQNLTIHENKLI